MHDTAKTDLRAVKTPICGYTVGCSGHRLAPPRLTNRRWCWLFDHVPYHYFHDYRWYLDTCQRCGESGNFGGSNY